MLFVSSCASTRTYTYSIDEKNTICNKINIDLGTVAILPEAAWRIDQKEPMKREQMALNEIRGAFNNLPCGNISAPGGIMEFSNWSNIPEATLLERFNNKDIDTIVIIRMEELTPRINVTFSIPFLWSGSNEADFRIKAISVKSGNILTDVRIKRVTGGPFNVRPAEWSKIELNAALLDIIGIAR